MTTPHAESADAFEPYANERDVLRIGHLEIENRIDRISLTGDVVLTRDRAGLMLAKDLQALLAEARATLGIADGGMADFGGDDFLEPLDIVSSMTKGAVFGFLAALMGCYYGMQSARGAQGVGSATKTAVVAASVLILAANFILTELFFAA